MNLGELKPNQTSREYSNKLKSVCGIKVNIDELNLDHAQRMLLTINEQIATKKKMSESRHTLHKNKLFTSQLLIRKILESKILELKNPIININEIDAIPVERNITSKSLIQPPHEQKYMPHSSTIVGKLKNGMQVGVYVLSKYKTNLIYVVLYSNQKKSTIIGKIQLRKSGATYISADSKISNKYQGQGLGLQLYQFIIKDMGILLKSDEQQSKGAQDVWRKLALTPGIFVYGYRTVSGKKPELFHVKPEGITDQLSGRFEVYHNDDDMVQIKRDLEHYKTDITQMYDTGEITDIEAKKRIKEVEQIAKKEIDELNMASKNTWLIATSEKKHVKNFNEFSKLIIPESLISCDIK